jgi:hypothetical protein
MSDIMQLNSVNSEGSVISRETRLRAWWSIYLADMWCISGLGLPSHLKDAAIMITPPMSESVFGSFDLKQHTLEKHWSPGLWAQLITLVQLFGPIQDLNRRIVNGDILVNELNDEVSRQGAQLDMWVDMLPSDAQMNASNLIQHQKMGLGGLLISLHLTYHHYSMLLYFHFLEAYQAPSPTDLLYIKRCRRHASCFSALIEKSRQLKGCDAVYPLVGHMTTVSSIVLVHKLLFGEAEELEDAREALNANFEALMELKQYWPVTTTWVR